MKSSIVVGWPTGVDVVFSGLPHGAAAATIVEALKSDVVVFDLSADFRLKDAAEFQRWYGAHPAPRLLADAVYGIPEFARERIRLARIIAVPGCYPTGALLGLVPIVRAGIVGDGPIVVDSKSGASGAGRAAKTELLFGEIQENVRAYSVGRHRHLPEIEQELAAARLPIRRDLHAAPAADSSRDSEHALRSAPKGRRSRARVRVELRERAVRHSFSGKGSFREVRDVRGTNLAQIGWTVLDPKPLAIVVTAIDNLGKGGSGQAVQNLNVRFGLDERTGLDQIAAVP